MKLSSKSSVLLLLSVFFAACDSKKDRIQEKSNTINANVIKKDSSSSHLDPILNKAPIINLVDTLMARTYIVYKKDSAASSIGIGSKLTHIYDKELPELLKEKKLTIVGPNLALFTSDAAPFYFEAGVFVNKAPGKLPKPFYSRTIPSGKVIVARYYGPYSNTVMAYEVLNEWLKTNKKKKRHTAYEVYVTRAVDENGKALDPFKVRTDIIFPYQ